ncbi:hypothetical protein E2C01_064394 [Portunus trituberculatus]|uniref:Uncharacterized protein n=1 Tax=Portunus trituberculatus TaxID=210409 RepID=A0A5B7HNM8_PORTR|nr:hypothetical protein [Portunus trituberculatus]
MGGRDARNTVSFIVQLQRVVFTGRSSSGCKQREEGVKFIVSPDREGQSGCGLKRKKRKTVD